MNQESREPRLLLSKFDCAAKIRTCHSPTRPCMASWLWIDAQRRLGLGTLLSLLQ
ncbi:hypothetical protein [Leptothermofonsia sp. ETS-13]|uniref:hypothetical protein n=1 Tax=Leptothermofonsia sp. ETS-13 TaxID=3035696 RepID=UPI003B9EA026